MTGPVGRERCERITADAAILVNDEDGTLR
jgi:hypothetical protein